MAYAMVVDYGMSDRLGPLSYNRSGRDDAPLLGTPYSDATAQAIDEEVQVLVEEARSRARTLLEDKRPLLDEMAATLLENEVLDRDALVELLGEPPHESYTPTQTQDVMSTGENHRPEGRPPSADGPDGSSSESGAASEEPETPGKTGP
jgi:cell division protease FtsH